MVTQPSLATARSAGFTGLVLSKYATVLFIKKEMPVAISPGLHDWPANSL
jgi:hypothetical protein